jgi:hypothetical protein
MPVQLPARSSEIESLSALDVLVKNLKDKYQVARFFVVFPKGVVLLFYR